MWTPRHQALGMGMGMAGFGMLGTADGGVTDSDVTPDANAVNSRNNHMSDKYRPMLAPPQTPSAHRSPTKQLEYDWARAQSRSPTKGRNKYY